MGFWCTRRKACRWFSAVFLPRYAFGEWGDWCLQFSNDDSSPVSGSSGVTLSSTSQKVDRDILSSGRAGDVQVSSGLPGASDPSLSQAGTFSPFLG